MKYIYTEKDLALISWELIDKFIDKLYDYIINYLEKDNLVIKYIVPIMRGEVYLLLSCHICLM